MDEAIQLWSLNNHRLFIGYQKDSVEALCLSKNNDFLISVGYDNMILFWDL